MLQYAHRRKSFILAWAGGWFALVPMSLVLAQPYASPLGARFAIGVSHLLGLVAAGLVLASGDLYRQTRYVKLSRWRWALAIAAWFMLSPMLLGPPAVQLPGYVLGALLLAGAAAMYAAVLIERRMIGAGLLAFVLLGLAIASLTSAVAPDAFGVRAPLTALTLVLYAVCAFGIHLFIFEDMTYELRVTNRQLEEARQELLQAAITDPLTGCRNRRFLEQVADRELRRHARFNLPLSLLFIDVNRFKAINDTLGHDAGDRVLVYVAQFLKRHIREADYVFRWGGDEFLVLITCTGTEAARKAAKLKAMFDTAPETVTLPPGIGLSVGWTEVPPDTIDLLPLIHEADEKMYQDKGRR